MMGRDSVEPIFRKHTACSSMVDSAHTMGSMPAGNQLRCERQERHEIHK